MPAIRVAIEDASGSAVQSATAEVTIRLAANPTGATLTGTTTVRALGGIATFTDLSLERPGDGFIFQAQSTGLPPATSAEFSVRLPFVQASAGGAHSCGVTVAGFAYCWGAAGQVGDGTAVRRLNPTPVVGKLTFAQLSAGIDHTCAVTTNNAAYCWGANGQGQLGDGTTDGRQSPTRVAGSASFTQVSAGVLHTCGVTGLRTAYCWGDSRFGKLGDGTGIGWGRTGVRPGERGRQP